MGLEPLWVGMWAVAGHCPKCGNPIWAKDREGEPVVNRSCDCEEKE